MLTHPNPLARTVLVYIPDTALQTRIAAHLQTGGYRVVLAQQPDDVPALCQSQFLDAVLLDSIPDEDQIRRLCREIRSIPACTETPLLVLISEETEGAPGLVESGASDIVSPGLVDALLLARLAAWTRFSETRQSLNRYSSLVHNSADAMIPTDLDARIIGWNDAATQIYGWTAEEAMGQVVDELLQIRFTGLTTAEVRAHLAQHRFWRGEVSQRHKSGREIYATLSVSVVEDTAGNVREYIGINRDITAQKQLENTLRVSEHQMRSILGTMTELVVVVDRSGRYVQIPSEHHPLLLRPATELMGRLIADVMPEEKADYLTARIRQALDNQQPVHIDYDVSIRGERRWFRGVLSPLEGERVLMVVHDVTDRHDTETILKETAGRYQQLFEYANDTIVLIDVESGMIMDANRQASRSLGYTHDELLRLHISDIEVPLTVEETESPSSSINSTGRLIIEQTYRHKSGIEVPVETSSRLISVNGRATILTFARDISERKRAREAEREQRLLAESLRDTAGALSSTLELDDVMDLILENVGRLIPVDSASIMLLEEGLARIIRIRGYNGIVPAGFGALQLQLSEMRTLSWMSEHRQPLLIMNTAWDERWRSDIRGIVNASYLAAPILLKGEVIGFINLDSNQPGHFRPDHVGRLEAFASQAAVAIHNARLYAGSLRYAEELEEQVNQRTAMLSQANEALKEQIVERQQIEEALEEERNLLRTLIDNLPDHVYVKDTQSRFLLGNRAVIQRLGCQSLEDLLHKTDFDFLPEKEARWRYDDEQRLMQTGQPLLNAELPSRELIKVPDAEQRWMLVSKIPLRDARGQITGMVGINRDITELKRVEQKLAEERNLLRTLVDTIPDLIYIKDTDSRFVMVNKQAARALGVEKPEDAIGKTDYDFYPHDQAQSQIELEKQIFESTMPILNLNGRFNDTRGNEFWHLMTRLPLRDAEDHITGLIGVNRDITELRNAEEQLQQILTSARCLLWFAVVEEQNDDYIWRLYVANEEAAQKFLPLDVARMSYTDAWQDSIVAEDRERRRYVFRTHLKFNRLNYSQELRCVQADGETRWLTEDVQIRQLTPGRWSMVGVCTDITERKNAETTLQKANDELEQRVAARTHELLQANAILKQEIWERKRAEEAERHQRILAEALRDSGAAINNTLNRDQVLNHILGAMSAVVPHEAANIMLRDGEYGQIVRHRGYGFDLHNRRFRVVGFKIFQEVLQTHQPHIVTDTNLYKGWAELDDFAWVRSNITIPIRLDEEIIGFLNLDSSEPNQFTEEHARWLQAFADQASIAIRNARMIDEIRRHAAELELRVDERTAELQYQRAQLEAILDAMRDGVIYYDLDDHPRYVNRAMSEISGYGTDELMGYMNGAHMSFASDEERETLMRKLEKSLVLHGIWKGDLEMIRRDESRFDASLTFTEVNNSEGQRLGVVAVIRDISQAKQLEEQKKRFIADAAHELRTPIANMKVRLHLLRRQPNKFEENIDIAQKAADWMQRLVDNLFDLARFERGVIELKREVVNLQQFVRDVVRFQEPEAERLGIEFSYTMPGDSIMINVDPYRMTQVITNLVGNALHYTRENGSVTLNVYVDHSTQEAVLRVIDTGVGIEEQHIPYLFQPFYRARNDDNRGAGLGLTITRDIVRLHGGTIGVESVTGTGSTFTVRLPLKEAPLPLEA
jgi:PAS domain S-box-containing protein